MIINRVIGILLMLSILIGSNYAYGFSPKKVIIPQEDIKVVRELTDAELGGGDYPCWSPDGKEVVYTIWAGHGIGLIAKQDIETGSFTSLTLPYSDIGDGSASEPDFSPDGIQIVCTIKKEEGISQVWKMDIDGQNKVKLTSEEYDCESPKWSPDGTRILFIPYDLYVMDPGGGDKTFIYESPDEFGEGIHKANWSPDGREIIMNMGGAVWTMDSNGTNLTKIVERRAGSSYGASWSPDGEKIVYTYVGEDRWNSRSIMLIDAEDGSNPVQLILPDDLMGQCPDWSPDGTKLVFVGKKAVIEPYEKHHREEAGIFILTLPPELQCPPKKKGEMEKARKIETEKGGMGEVFEAKRPKKNIIIDGRLNEWTDVKEVSMDKNEYVIYEPSNWQGKDDLSAMAMVQGDDKNLYLAVEVKDDKFVQQFSGDKILNGDHLEVWFATPKGTYQLGISPGDFEKLGAEVLLWLPGVSTKKKQDILKGTEVASKKDSTGYFLEAKIPLANLGIDPQKNKSIGFTVVISDTDNKAKPKQDCLLASSELKWNKPETFGKLVFK
ncbi:MAG: sugar-binding protein [bacterium]|nr:sugar-binding protein [bacterium]